MFYKDEWKREYENEIEHAVSARVNGNEGLARVCARRAAGIIIGEYLIHQGYINIGNSTFDRISIFTSLPNVDDQYREIAYHFLLKVNHDHNLPEHVDLIQDAKLLCKYILFDETGRLCAS